MKYIIAAVVFSFCINYTYGQDQKFSTQKSYSKSYAIKATDSVSLDNQFGEIKLLTWEKNQIKVDISMTASSSESMEEAKKLLDLIQIKESRTSAGVIFKSQVTKKQKQAAKTFKNVHEEMKINYTVYLPSANPLSIKNHFGPIVLRDYHGKLNVESQFGSLNAGRLTNVGTINVQFGNANIQEVNPGVLEIHHSTIIIKRLTGNIKTNLQFSTVKIGIDNSTKNLGIQSYFTSVYLDLSETLSASYEIAVANGSFTNKSKFQISSTREKVPNDTGPKYYTGKSANGDNRITINSSYGSIIVGHNLKVDMNKVKKT